MCVCILMYSLFGITFKLLGRFFLFVLLAIFLLHMTLSCLKLKRRGVSELHKDGQSEIPEKYIKMLVLVLSVKMAEFYCCHWSDQGRWQTPLEKSCITEAQVCLRVQQLGLMHTCNVIPDLCFILKVGMWHFKKYAR